MTLTIDETIILQKKAKRLQSGLINHCPIIVHIINSPCNLFMLYVSRTNGYVRFIKLIFQMKSKL